MVREWTGREKMIAQNSSLIYLEELPIAMVSPLEDEVPARVNWEGKLVLLGF